MSADKDLFLKRFEDKLKSRLDSKALESLQSDNPFYDEDLRSIDYETFRDEKQLKSISFYDTYVAFSKKVFTLKAPDSTRKKLDGYIYNAHLSCDADGVMSAAGFTSIILLILAFSFMIFINQTIGYGFVFIAAASYFIMQKVPKVLAQRMRAKASDQIIISVFYMVAYMRFNSNFELAVNFAANYLPPPLSLDFKRLLWELNNTKYSSIQKAFEKYLEGWRDENLEFLEAVYLIESSLYESEEFRRISLLDKSLDIILQGNYEKMVHFAQVLRGKIGTFNMLGVVLPILGLIILPLAASFSDPKGTWEVVLLLYNILFPAFLVYFALSIVMSRPSAISATKIPDHVDPKLIQVPVKLTKKKTLYFHPKYPALAIFFGMFLMGLLPLGLHALGSQIDTQTGECSTSIEVGINSALAATGIEAPFDRFQRFNYIDSDTGDYCYGPYGTLVALFSLLIPLSFVYSISYYLKYRYQNLIGISQKTKRLEKEFPSATFQLGNRINEGISAELAFGAVADTMRGTEAGDFFSVIDRNIKFNGMSIENAIFDSERGAIKDYPSDLILSSMKILTNSIQRGPEITAKTLIDLSKYLSDIHKSGERLLDLLAETLGSMKGQASFLAPMISGVVVAIVSLVTYIMGLLKDSSTELMDGAAAGAGANFIGYSIPTYLFQSVVGVYMVSLIIVLIYVVTNLEYGEDPVNTKYQIAMKLKSAMLKYSLIVAVGIVAFGIIGSRVLGGMV